jgi:hypothetical protein
MTQPPNGESYGKDQPAQPGQPLQDDEIRDFEERLQAWGEQLPPAQLGILALVLDRARRQEHREYEGLAVSTWRESLGSLMTPYLNHLYQLRETDGGTPDGGWVSWAAKLE